MRAGAELARGLVEADVAVRADAEDLEVDPAGVGDRRLVAGALRFQVRAPRRSRKLICSRRNADAAEQVPLHELPVAAGVRRRRCRGTRRD